MQCRRRQNDGARKMQRKFIKACGLAAFCLFWFHGQGVEAAYSANSDTSSGLLDFLENQARDAREKRLDDAQKDLLKDTAKMREQLRQPLTKDAPMPASFEGHDLLYDQETGEFYARGKVRITTLDNRRFTSNEVRGNVKETYVDVPERGHILQMDPNTPTVELYGYNIHYNYGEKQGTMAQAHGKVAKQYVTGKKFEIYPDRVVIHDGSATRCSAKSPDYRITAKEIIIYPNDKIIFNDADIWLKRFLVAHRDHYETNLSPDSQDKTPMPRLRYNRDDGLMLSYSYPMPLAKHVDFVPMLRLTTSAGVRSNAEVRWQGMNGTMRLEEGYYQDSDEHWIKKSPSLRFDQGAHFKGLPIGYGFNAERGQWYARGIKSIHTMGRASLYHDPILLGKDLRLLLDTNYSVTRESYDHSKVAGISWNAAVTKVFDDHWAAYTRYAYSKLAQQNALFDYGLPDYNRTVYTGFSYRFDEANRMVVGTAYDAGTHTLADVDYYWYHNMHCAELITRWRAKRDTLNVTLQFAPW